MRILQLFLNFIIIYHLINIQMILKNWIFYIINLTLLLSGCAYLSYSTYPEPPTYHHSKDLKTVTFNLPYNNQLSGERIDSILTTLPGRLSYTNYFEEISDDSLRAELSRIMKQELTGQQINIYTLAKVSSTKTSTILTFSEDSLTLKKIADELMFLYGDPARESLTSLSPNGANITIEELKNLNLLLPCAGVTLPKRANLLPNAPRPYRSGIHRGIDFPASYGSEVRSVLDGIVIQATHGYREISPELRESFLIKARKIGRTPHDVYNHITLGRSVTIDHGMYLIPGKRIISVYSHLSQIDDHIQAGTAVVQGEIIGLSGNSGTRDGSIGSLNNAHLHFELIIQDKRGESYLGQELEYEELYNLLTSIFAGI